MAYQIYRTEKLKHMGNIGSSGSHMMRNRKTPNANPEIDNRILVGSKDPARDVSRLLPAKDARGSDGKLLRTAQSVLAIEVFVGTSPEWWDKATPEMQEDWLRSSVRQLAKQYGKNNIAHLQVHYDEKTPHITGFVVPKDEVGRLNAKLFLGSRAKMRQMQTDMAKAVEHLGLQRGIEGSKAEHQRVTRHYGAIKRKIRPIKIDAPTVWDFISPSKYAEEQRQKAQRQASGLFERAKATETAKTSAKAAQATSESLSRRNKSLEKDLERERKRAQANELRALPLPQVADLLGLEPDPKDRSIWRGPGDMKIGMTEKDGSWKFYDNGASKGGGGAIDLAMHCMGSDYKGALAWLAANFGHDATGQEAALQVIEKAKRDVSQAVKERPPFQPPEQVEANWNHVRNWLITERKLPAEVVDQLHQKGDVYADDRRNAVFVCRAPDGKPTGAELKGTTGSKFAGMAPGSMKHSGGFRLGKLHAKAVYLVESAIDAISLYVLRKNAGDKSLAVVSAAGSSPTPPSAIADVIPDDVQKFNAYDADAKGDKAAAMMGWDRHRPPAEGADWNQILKDGQDGSAAAVTRHEEDGPAGPKM